MNPLHLSPSLELLLVPLAFFVAGSVAAIAILSATWLGKPPDFSPERYGTLCIVSGGTAFLLFGFTQWMNAHPEWYAPYFVQLSCVLLSGLLFGVFAGCGFSVLLRAWQWHKRTPLRNTIRRR